MDKISAWLNNSFDSETQVDIKQKGYDTWRFEKGMSNRLIELVLEGKKRATASAYTDDEKQSKIGGYGVILDYDDNPRCLVKYTASEIKPFDKVDFEFAQAEGEDFSDLQEWRKEHMGIFKKADPNFTSSSLVLCEQFKCVTPNLDQHEQSRGDS